MYYFSPVRVFESLRLQSPLKTHGSETYKKADVFIRDLLQMINKFAALLLIGMASPYQILDWYGGRHTCHTASGALGRSPYLNMSYLNSFLKGLLC